MKFDTEEKKQAYLANLQQMVTEITEVKPNPDCPGYSIWKDSYKIAACCFKLEKMITDVEDNEVKAKILQSLSVVENHYNASLNRRFEMPCPSDIRWCQENINFLQISLNNLNVHAPTERTRIFYCAFVENYSQFLQDEINAMTPGHPDCIKQYKEELRATIEHAQAVAAHSNSPVFMMLPRDPNHPENQTDTIVTFAPGTSGAS